MAQTPFLSIEELWRGLPPYAEVAARLENLNSEEQVKVKLAYLRADFGAFLTWAFEVVEGKSLVPNWHLDVLAQVATDFACGRNPVTLVNLPPRFLKSFIMAIALPAWWQLHRPKLKTIVVTYGEDLSREHYEKFSRLCRHPWYQRMLEMASIKPLDHQSRQHTLGFGSDRIGRFKNSYGGTYITTTTGGALTGMGTDVLIIDDPIKAEDALSKARRDTVNNWFSNTALSRFNDPSKKVVLVVMQRLHENDLSGHLLELGGVNHVVLPAQFHQPRRFDLRATLFKPKCVIEIKTGDLLQGARLSEVALAQEQKILLDHTYFAQYLQDPTPAQGSLFKLDWFGSSHSVNLCGTGFLDAFGAPYDRAVLDKAEKCRCEFALLVSWDTALTTHDTSDFSVGTVWLVKRHQCPTGAKHPITYHLIQMWRGKFDLDQMASFHKKAQNVQNKTHVLVEASGAGFALHASLSAPYVNIPLHQNFRLITPTRSKEQRAEMAAQKIKAGQVFLPATAPWLEDFKSEITGFPGGKHDDIVDSMSQALNFDIPSLFPPPPRPSKQPPRPRFAKDMEIPGLA